MAHLLLKKIYIFPPNYYYQNGLERTFSSNTSDATHIYMHPSTTKKIMYMYIYLDNLAKIRM